MGDALIRLLLVRHGVTIWNQQIRYQGHHDVPLGDEGRAQAERLAARLAGESIDAVYTSDLARARETAEVATRRHGVRLTETPALREMCFGAWEGMRYDEIAVTARDHWEAWIRDPVGVRPPGGESLEQVRARIVAFFHSVVKLPPADGEATDRFSYRGAGEPARGDQRTILFVTHGGPVRVLLTHLLNMPTRRYWQFGVRPASLTALELYPDGAIAEVIGDTSHLW